MTTGPTELRVSGHLLGSRVVTTTMNVKPRTNCMVGENQRNGRRTTPSTAFRALVNLEVNRGRGLIASVRSPFAAADIALRPMPAPLQFFATARQGFPGVMQISRWTRRHSESR